MRLHSFYLISPGPRPPFYSVAEYLWGAGCNVDSDGDSDPADSSDWTELTLILRTDPGEGPRVDVDPLDGPALVLWIRSEDERLAERTAAFLAGQSGGILSRDRP
jgi:hypothetical protein